MKKLAAFLALLILGTTGLSARFYTTPYQFGHRWNIAVQGGPTLFYAENSESYKDNTLGWTIPTWHAAFSIGYNFSNAHELRVSFGYGQNHSALNPYGGFYPFSFRAAHVFADYLLNFNGLGEYDTGFNPRMYAGLGCAYSFGITEVAEHPFQVTHEPNIVPGIRVGTVLEYDFRSGLGLFADFGVSAYTDWYNGLEPISFPLDVEIKLSLGVIYHFPGAKR